jgi:putative hydrolase of the HAD superfamily
LPDSREPKAILFDLDDTIIAHSTAGDSCWQELCNRFAPLVEGLKAEKLLDAVNRVRDWYWDDPERHRRGRLNLIIARRELVALAFSNLGINNTDLANQLADAYSAEREEAVTLFPGAVDTLKHFRNRGIKLALVSNGSGELQRKKIERFNLVPFFDCITIEGEFGLGKPDERVFLHTLEKLSAAAKEAWMVGDNLEWDVAGAQKAGIYGIWVDWQGNGLPESSTVRPDRIVNSISELV